MDDHLRHHFPKCLAEFDRHVAALVLHDFCQLLDILAESFDRLRLQFNEVAGRLFSGQVSFESIPLQSQPRHDGGNIIVFDLRPRNLIDDPGNPLLDISECRFLRVPAGAALCGNPFALRLVLLNVGIDDAGVCEHGPKPVDDVALDLLNIVAAGIVAASGFPVPAAHHSWPGPIGAGRSQRSAARRAFEDACQQSPRSGRLLPLGSRHLFFPRFHGLKQIFVDNPQVWRVHDLVFARIVFSGYSPACRRIFHHPDPVPYACAGIEGIAEDAMAALVVAVECRGVPLAPARGRDTFLVENARYGPRAHACGIEIEHASDDRRFALDYAKIPSLPRDRLVSIRLAGSIAAGAHKPGHPALCLLRTFLTLHLADHAIHTDLDGIQRAAVDAVYFDFPKFQRFVDVGEIRDVSRYAIGRLGNQHVEITLFGRTHQLRQPRPAEHRCSRLCSVEIFPHHLGADPLCMRLAKFNLIFDGSVVLQVGAVAGVDDGAFHGFLAGIGFSWF